MDSSRRKKGLSETNEILNNKISKDFFTIQNFLKCFIYYVISDEFITHFILFLDNLFWDALSRMRSYPDSHAPIFEHFSRERTKERQVFRIFIAYFLQ